MSERTCSVDGCWAPHRARGLCSTHYNQLVQPNRHQPRVVPCTVCGTMVTKTGCGQRRPVCSTDCRWFLQFEGANCLIPERHPAHPDYEPSVPRPTKKTAEEIAALLRPKPCNECGMTFQPRTTRQTFCSERCSVRTKRRARKAREHKAQGTFTWTQVIKVFLLFDRCCAYCAQPVVGQPDPDHVIPLSRDGHNSVSNILPSCRLCNSDKRDLLLREWNADRARRGLPPRITTWMRRTLATCT